MNQLANFFILIASLAADMRGAKLTNCEDAIHPKIESFDDSRVMNARVYRSPREIRARLAAANLSTPVAVSPYRQYPRACYLYSLVGQLQSELLTRKILAPGDYLDGFMMGLRIARERVRLRPRADNLNMLLDSGNSEVYEYLPPSPIYYLDAASVAKLGGLTKVQDLEHGILRRLNTSLKRYGMDQFESFLDFGPRQFDKLAREELEQHLSRAAGEPIHLRAKKIRRFGFVDVSKNSKSGELQTQDYIAENGTWNDPITSRREHFNFEFEVLRPALHQLAHGHTVAVSLDHLYDRPGYQGRYRGSAHRVLLVAADIRNGVLQGFKYLNTKGPRFGENGYGYIDRHTLERYWYQSVYIEELDVENVD